MRTRGEITGLYLNRQLFLNVAFFVSTIGGAGGKGTWGQPGSELTGVEEGINDPHDPNYDSDSEVRTLSLN